jgi:hypothetical protein
VRQILHGGLADGAHRLPPCDAVDDAAPYQAGLPSLPHGIFIMSKCLNLNLLSCIMLTMIVRGSS